jgi:outer membrane protein assembly factor BamE (lipoprotein component of BamABCDE complex)
MSVDKSSRKELRAKLRAKLDEKRIGRSSKIAKEQVLERTFKKAGLDKKLFDESLKLLQKIPEKKREQILNSTMKKAIEK